jgi:5'(3')-deoxyribonucleotidase
MSELDPHAHAAFDRPDGLRIGIDMDGVLADFTAGWIARYNAEFGTALQASDVQRWEGLHGLTHFADMDAFWTWARADGVTIFRDLPPIPGAIETIRDLARRHRIVIVSSKFDWAIPDSLAWLARHGVTAREVHFVWRKSTVPCDVYLEDAPHQLEELVASRPASTVCRMVQPWNDDVPGTVAVRSWDQFAAVIEGLASGR